VRAVAERPQARFAAAAQGDRLAPRVDRVAVLVEQPERAADEQRAVAVGRDGDLVRGGHAGALPSPAASQREACGILAAVTPPSVGITRRRALLAAAVAAGVALVPAAPARAARLTLGRAASYSRLVTTLGQAPDGRFRVRGAVAAARDFAAWYVRQDPAVRAHADAVLDTVRVPGDYAALQRAARPAAGADTALVVAAVNLAAVTCMPPPDEDEHPLVPAL
jgi:hypothetical protein